MKIFVYKHRMIIKLIYKNAICYYISESNRRYISLSLISGISNFNSFSVQSINYKIFTNMNITNISF